MDCDVKQKATCGASRTVCENRTAFPLKNWILFLEAFCLHGTATDAQQRRLRSQFIASCGSKVKFRSMCVEVRQKVSGISKAFGNPRQSGNHSLHDEGVTSVSSCLGSISSYNCYRIHTLIKE